MKMEHENGGRLADFISCCAQLVLWSIAKM